MIPNEEQAAAYCEYLDQCHDRATTGESRRRFIDRKAVELECDAAWLDRVWHEHRRKLTWKEKEERKSRREVELTDDDLEREAPPAGRGESHSDVRRAVAQHMLEWLGLDLTKVEQYWESAGYIELSPDEDVVTRRSGGSLRIGEQTASWLNFAVVVKTGRKPVAVYPDVKIAQIIDASQPALPRIYHADNEGPRLIDTARIVRIVRLKVRTELNRESVENKLAQLTYAVQGSRCEIPSMARLGEMTGRTRAAVSAAVKGLRQRMKDGRRTA